MPEDWYECATVQSRGALEGLGERFVAGRHAKWGRPLSAPYRWASAVLTARAGCEPPEPIFLWRRPRLPDRHRLLLGVLNLHPPCLAEDVVLVHCRVPKRGALELAYGAWMVAEGHVHESLLNGAIPVDAWYRGADRALGRGRSNLAWKARVGPDPKELEALVLAPWIERAWVTQIEPLDRVELQSVLQREFERSGEGPFDPFSEELNCGLLVERRDGWFRVDP
ncbi:MAG: hypothetical protein AAFZ65_19125, partial [Planctomycetota bacterium]